MKPSCEDSCPKAPVCRILVVDDNRDAADTLAALLKIWGHEVWVAYDGPSAVTLAVQYLPDVVLLDLGLPHLSGYEVALQIRQIPDVACARIIAITGYVREDDRRRTKEAGFDDHLAKPVDPGSLEALVLQACHKN